MIVLNTFFFVSGQLIEPLLIGADFLQEYGFVVNFKTSSLIYEIEGNMKECKFTNTAEKKLEPRKSRSHGLPETAEDDVTQTLNEEPVWNMSK
jgi:hypothetical protein